MTSNLTPEQWSEVKRLFLACSRMSVAEREEYLSGVQTSGGPERHSETVERARQLLKAEAETPAFIEHPEQALGFTPIPRAIADLPRKSVEGPLPRFIGSCTIIRMLGEGTFGVVYLAEQRRPQRRVAVKVIRPELSSAAALRRLEREAEIVAGLRHSGVAQVLESGVDALTHRPYVVMELVEGEPITAHARRRNLDIPARLRLFLRVCDAVQHAHGAGVIHRDLKPGNILVTESGDPKILDFGVARVQTTSADAATLASHPGQLVGTLGYMSPEQTGAGAEGVDTRTDVYSLGAVLHEMLTGRPPLSIAGKSLFEALQSIQTEKVARIGVEIRALRGDLETIVAKSLEKNREHRYASVSELAGDIRRHLERLPIQARPPGALYEVMRFTARHRSLMTGIGVALLTIVAALAWTVTSRHRERQDYLAARNMAGAWLADVMQQLGPVAGTHEVRERVLDEIRAPVERLASRYPADLELQGALAEVYFASGVIQSERGHVENAETFFRRSYSIFTILAETDETNADWRLRRSIAAVKVGDMLTGAEKWSEARPWYELAMIIDRAATIDFPQNYTAHDQIVWSYERLSSLTRRLEGIEHAWKLCEEMGVAAERLERFTGASFQPKIMFCRLAAMQSRADLLGATGKDLEAQELRAQSLQLGRELVAIAPEKRAYVYRQVYALAGEAAANIRLHELAAAEKVLEEALPHVEHCVALDGHERAAHDAAIVLHTTYRDLWTAHGDSDRAIASLLRAVTHAKKGADRQPSASEAALTAASLWMQLIGALREADREDEAADITNAAREFIETRIEMFPANRELQTLLKQCQPVADATPTQ